MHILARFRIVLAMLVAMIALSGALRAQCPTPTYPDCNTAWSYTCYNVSVTNGGSTCTFTICFCYRHACNLYYDMIIKSITPDDPDCCAGWDGAVLVEGVRNSLMKANPMGFPISPCPNFETTTWRFVDGTCYYLDQAGVRFPCSGAATCWQQYRICRNPDGTVQLTLLHSGPAADNCTAPSQYFCYPTCPSE